MSGDNVIDLQAHREARESVFLGSAQCSLCGHTWRAGVSLTYDGRGLECPSCGEVRAGLFPVADPQERR